MALGFPADGGSEINPRRRPFSHLDCGRLVRHSSKGERQFRGKFQSQSQRPGDSPSGPRTRPAPLNSIKPELSPVFPVRPVVKRWVPYQVPYRYRCGRSRNTLIMTTPATKPPTCAQKATPPEVWLVSAIAMTVPLRKFPTNQYPSISHAGTWKKKIGGNQINTRARGYRIK